MGYGRSRILAWREGRCGMTVRAASVGRDVVIESELAKGQREGEWRVCVVGGWERGVGGAAEGVVLGSRVMGGGMGGSV